MIREVLPHGAGLQNGFAQVQLFMTFSINITILGGSQLLDVSLDDKPTPACAELDGRSAGIDKP